jgi:NifU-like protein
MKHSSWMFYTHKLQDRVLHPKCVGYFTEKEALFKEARLAIGTEGNLTQGHLVKLYLLVSQSEGVILDARFQAFGPPALIGAADAVCEMLLNKNYAQASRISADLIDKKLRDHPSIEAFSEEMYKYLNGVLFALLEATSLCQDILITAPYAHSPVVEGRDENGNHGSNHMAAWTSYSLEEKLSVIREVIKEEIEPYIALDEGGVEVTELKDDKEVIVVYQGSCTTCFSAIGATLNAIQQILRDKVHPELIVTPDTSVLKF